MTKQARNVIYKVFKSVRDKLYLKFSITVMTEHARKCDTCFASALCLFSVTQALRIALNLRNMGRYWPGANQ